MVPPALFKVVQYIAQAVLDNLKNQGVEQEHSEIPHNHSFHEPGNNMHKSENVEEGIPELLEFYLKF